MLFLKCKTIRYEVCAHVEYYFTLCRHNKSATVILACSRLYVILVHVKLYTAISIKVVPRAKRKSRRTTLIEIAVYCIYPVSVSINISFTNN
jgi:hypothetical protein